MAKEEKKTQAGRLAADMDKLLPVIRNKTPYVVVDEFGRIIRAGVGKKTLEKFAELGPWRVMETREYARACGLEIVEEDKPKDAGR